MGKFDKYFLMKSDDIAEFVKEKTNIFDKNATLTVNEIGDGNLNYVFRVVDKKTDKSVIVKHAGESLRIDSTMKASTDRNRIESEILKLQYKFAPKTVPEIHFYDTVMCACIMEDLRGYEMMRTAMVENKIFPKFSEHITDFIVKTQLPTTDVVMDHSEKKLNVQKFINPDLCEITEDLVLSEPYNDCHGKNVIIKPNKEFAEKQLYNDRKLSLEVAKLKFKFMNYPQALIHGDLHTGSIFINPEDTRIFDPEFAFFGPIGYDLGNVVANLMFAWANGHTKGSDDFCNWIEKSIVEVIDKFKEKSIKYLNENSTEIMSKVDGFTQYYVDDILSDTAGYAGTELHRRIVGMAKVKDITSIQDEEKRAKMERVCILTGKEFILGRDQFKDGKAFLDVFKKSVSECE